MTHVGAREDECAIRHLYDGLYAATEAGDGTALQALVTADFESPDPHGVVTIGRAKFAEAFSIFSTYVSVGDTQYSLRHLAIDGDAAELDMESEVVVASSPIATPICKHLRSHDWLRREDDGIWRIACSVSEFIGPPAPPFDDDQ